ncbi:MAG TPA: hypothetical protein VML55_20070 [Planctomycetaceae bacterium]|nr:hypothetical protein [Planctomycetaceae bacterium]
MISRSGWVVLGLTLLASAGGLAWLSGGLEAAAADAVVDPDLLVWICTLGGLASLILAWWNPRSLVAQPASESQPGRRDGLDFDLFSLTVAGWLLALATVAVVGLVYWAAYAQTWVPLEESKRTDKLVGGLLCVPAAAAFVLAGRAVLMRLGVTLVGRADGKSDAAVDTIPPEE